MSKYLLVIIFINLIAIQSKIWTPTELSTEFKFFNSIIDPESYFQEENLSEKLKNSYIKNNRIYEKLDVNLFIISRIHNDYFYRNSKFAEMLIENIETNSDIPKENRKTSCLTIIIALKQEIVIINPSEKLKKYLPYDFIRQIVEEVRSIIQTKNYTKAVIFLFEKLDAYWNKYRIKDNGQKNKKNQYSKDHITEKVKNIAFIEGYIFFSVFLILFTIGLYTKKKYEQMQSKNNNKIKIDNICAICLDDIIIRNDKENLISYEEICIKQLDKKSYIAILKCGHIYHAYCMDSWEFACEKNFQFDVKCPQCRHSDLEKLSSQNLTLERQNSIRRSQSLIEEPQINDQPDPVEEERREIERNFQTLNQIIHLARQRSTGNIEYLENTENNDNIENLENTENNDNIENEEHQ